MGNHKEAIQDLSIATILDSKMVLAYYYRGVSYYETGDFSYAIANYDHAIKLDPKLANAYYHRAIIHGEVGRINQSIKDFKYAASLAKEQKNFYLHKKATNAQLLAKKLKKSNLNNNSLLTVFKVGVIAVLIGLAIGNIQYFSEQIKEQETNKNHIAE